MRLWSIHPKYLDPIGLVALWREALLGRSVLIRGDGSYYNHPQLLRFKNTENPVLYINHYLKAVFDEARIRGYNFDISKIPKNLEMNINKIKINSGQVIYEWNHLRSKLELRNPEWLKKIINTSKIELHPLFLEVPGQKEKWEK